MDSPRVCIPQLDPREEAGIATWKQQQANRCRQWESNKAPNWESWSKVMPSRRAWLVKASRQNERSEKAIENKGHGLIINPKLQEALWEERKVTESGGTGLFAFGMASRTYTLEPKRSRICEHREAGSPCCCQNCCQQGAQSSLNLGPGSLTWVFHRRP